MFCNVILLNFVLIHVYMLLTMLTLTQIMGMPRYILRYSDIRITAILWKIALCNSKLIWYINNFSFVLTDMTECE